MRAKTLNFYKRFKINTKLCKSQQTNASRNIYSKSELKIDIEILQLEIAIYFKIQRKFKYHQISPILSFVGKIYR